MEKGFLLPAAEKGKSSIAGQGQPKHVVICFSPLAFVTDSMYYRFESFPISKLTRGDKYLKRKRSDDCPSLPAPWEKPEGVFVWRDNDDPSDLSNPRHWGMNFLHVGGGQVYAAGGVAPGNPEETSLFLFSSAATLNKDFRCISLSTPLESSTVECKSSMRINTYNPLIVEMGGLIYVLSAPPDLASNHTESTGFEVYNPLTDAWTTLETPIFLEEPHGTLSNGVSGYSSVVIGNKLCVSTTQCSATFDTETKEWGPCNLFSECKFKPLWPRTFGPKYFGPGDTGPSFPFQRNAIFYRNNIILCARARLREPGLVAFKITDDKEKAIQMPLQFADNMPKQINTVDIVDLGDDCFAVLTDGTVIPNGGDKYEIVIVTFKVVSEMMKNEEGEVEVAGLVCELMNMTHADAACPSGKGWRDPIYWFTM